MFKQKQAMLQTFNHQTETTSFTNSPFTPRTQVNPPVPDGIHPYTPGEGLQVWVDGHWKN